MLQSSSTNGDSSISVIGVHSPSVGLQGIKPPPPKICGCIGGPHLTLLTILVFLSNKLRTTSLSFMDITLPNTKLYHFDKAGY